MRRLYVTPGGRWYLALTLGLGVAALASANNVLYLIESLLLSGLLFSGIVSERAVSALEIEIRKSPARAGLPTRDWIRVTNRRRFPVYCAEIALWKDDEMIPIGFIPKIGKRESLSIPSTQVIAERGHFTWDGLAIVTAYPFGFARKTRIIDSPGKRLVWPAPLSASERKQAANEAAKQLRAAVGQERAEGEIRELNSDDDYRNIVWTLSARGGPWMVRPRSSTPSHPSIVLDLRTRPGVEFEKSVSRAATPLYLADDSSASLIVISQEGRKTIRGKVSALNLLAEVKAQS